MIDKRYINKNESVIDTFYDQLINAGNEESAEIFVDILNEKDKKISYLIKENKDLRFKNAEALDKIEELKNILTPKCESCKYFFDFPKYQLKGYKNAPAYCIRKEYFLSDYDDENCELWWLNRSVIK